MSRIFSLFIRFLVFFVLPFLLGIGVVEIIYNSSDQDKPKEVFHNTYIVVQVNDGKLKPIIAYSTEPGARMYIDYLKDKFSKDGKRVKGKLKIMKCKTGK